MPPVTESEPVQTEVVPDQSSSGDGPAVPLVPEASDQAQAG